MVAYGKNEIYTTTSFSGRDEGYYKGKFYNGYAFNKNTMQFEGVGLYIENPSILQLTSSDMIGKYVMARTDDGGYYSYTGVGKETDRWLFKITQKPSFYGTTLELYADKWTAEEVSYPTTKISRVIGRASEYPSNGAEDGYYYIRRGEVTSSNITSPTNGQVLERSHKIEWADTEVSQYDIEISTNNGSSWKRIATNVSGNSYTYNFANEPNTTTAQLRIRNSYSEGVGGWKSSAGTFTIRGITTTARLTVPSGGETIDKNFTIEWTDNQSSSYDIEVSLNNGATWSNLINGATGRSKIHDFSNISETSYGKLRIRNTFSEGSGNWVESSNIFTIKHDYPPHRPTGLRPFAGEVIDSTQSLRFQWDHNHANTQSEFDLEWSQDHQTWTRISRVSTFEQYTVDADTFPSGDIYWRVRTYSDAGLVSVWSNIEIFIATKPSQGVTIVSSPLITNARPIFEWSQTEQYSYEIEILNSIGQVAWGTGVVDSQNKTVTSGIELLDNNNYTFRIRTATELGLWTDWATQSLIVTYLGPPTPSIELSSGKGVVEVRISNPIPEGLEPEVEYNDLYRNGIRIATRVGTYYSDYSVRSNESYHYKVVAVGYNKNVSESSSRIISIHLEYGYFADKEGNILEVEIINKRDVGWELLGSKMHFVGREKPVFQYSGFKDNTTNLNFTLYNEEDLALLEKIYNNGGVILYRDNKGRKIYGVIPSISIDDNLDFDGWVGVNLSLYEIDYSEEV